MLRLAYSYKITNNLNNRFYIGVRGCRKNTDIFGDNYFGSGMLVQQAIKAYGKENMFKEILLIFPCFNDALNWEKEFVTQMFLDENPLCYNIHPGGGGGSLPGKNHPSYGKQGYWKNKKNPKLSAAKTGKRRLDMMGDNNVSRRPEVRAKLSAAQTGKSPWNKKVK